MRYANRLIIFVFLHRQLGKVKCHPECLGDCTNTTSYGCFVCQNYRHNGKCVQQCPYGTFAAESRMECVTEQVCRKLRRFPMNGKCLKTCPPGYRVSKEIIGTCVECAECYNKCYFSKINSLSIISTFEGCHWYQGDLTIKLPTGSPGTIELLKKSLADLRVINGSLKIHRSPALTSLEFLSNLHTITGSTLWPGDFALIINGNDNLKRLWRPTGDKLNITEGRLMIAYNSKLCLSEIHQFQNDIIERGNQSTKDILDTSNGYEQICHSKVIAVDVTHVTDNNATFEWRSFEAPSTQRVAAYFIYLMETEHQNATHTLPETCSRYVCHHQSATFNVNSHTQMHSIIRYESFIHTIFSVTVGHHCSMKSI